MLKKALILFSCLFLLSGCSLLADSGTKKELMESMDKLMDHHDKNMSKQRQMINDYNTANQLGNDISQALNQGITKNESQFDQLMSALDKANADLNAYKQEVQSLLNEIPAVESKANELKNEETKSRATKYLEGFKKATQSQVEYINNFQSLIDSYRQAYIDISHGNQPNVDQYDEYSKKEGELVDKFNKEIDAFNADWKTLNEKDFNREVKPNLSF